MGALHFQVFLINRNFGLRDILLYYSVLTSFTQTLFYEGYY